MFRSFAKPRIVLTRTHSPSKSHHTTDVCGEPSCITVLSAPTRGNSTRPRGAPGIALVAWPPSSPIVGISRVPKPLDIPDDANSEQVPFRPRSTGPTAGNVGCRDGADRPYPAPHASEVRPMTGVTRHPHESPPEPGVIRTRGPRPPPTARCPVGAASGTRPPFRASPR